MLYPEKMETLEQLLERIEAHRSAADMEKFNWAIEPALNLGIRNFLTRMIDDHVAGLIDEIDIALLIELLMETELVDDEIHTQATRLNNAVRIARRTDLVRYLCKKYGGQFEEMLRESEQTLDNADQYLDEAKEFLETLLEIVKEN